MPLTDVALFRFGPKTKGRPRLPRLGIDFFPDEQGMIGLESPASGASLYADVSKCIPHGHYFKLPAGTYLPDGLLVVADGQATHHTLYPSERMSWQRFV